MLYLIESLIIGTSLGGTQMDALSLRTNTLLSWIDALLKLLIILIGAIFILSEKEGVLKTLDMMGKLFQTIGRIFNK